MRPWKIVTGRMRNLAGETYLNSCYPKVKNPLPLVILSGAQNDKNSTGYKAGHLRFFTSFRMTKSARIAESRATFLDCLI